MMMYHILFNFAYNSIRTIDEHRTVATVNGFRDPNFLASILTCSPGASSSFLYSQGNSVSLL